MVQLIFLPLYSIYSLFLIIVITTKTNITNEVVFTTTHVYPGEAPTKIKKTNKSAVISFIPASGIVLNPAVLAVTL